MHAHTYTHIYKYFIEFDYIPLGRTLSFDLTLAPEEQCVSISIVDDDISESTESFSVMLSEFSESDVLLNPRSTTVSITDNDGKQCRNLVSL